MDHNAEEEESDSVWRLLRSSRRVRAPESFSRKVAKHALLQAQESAIRPSAIRPIGFLRLVRQAPVAWKMAAAAVFGFGFFVASISIYSPSPLDSEATSAATSAATSEKDEPSLAPFDDTFAIEEIDMILRIQDPDALEEEDLLLLLLPDPELL